MGTEEPVAQRQQKSEHTAEQQCFNDVQQRKKNCSGKAECGMTDHVLRDRYTDRIGDQTGCVIRRNDRQQHIRKRTACLVLTNDQQSRGRRRGSGQRTQHDAYDRVEAEHKRKHHCADDCEHGFKQRDEKGGFSDRFQAFQFEFITDGERDEAEGAFGDDAEGCKHIVSDQIEHTGADQDTCDQIGCDIREFDKTCQARHEKSAHHREGGIEQRAHQSFATPSQRVIGSVKRIPVFGSFRLPATS